ncbi:MAG: NADH-quinone oxidoreductase subunit M [Nitrospirales bacterium]|nr:MAG: NADH-quinone oxidoreductase subunit M [Nitrospirales bacterium]
MSIFTEHIISWMVVIPFLGIALLGVVRDQEWIRRIAFGCTMMEFAVTIILCQKFEFGKQGMQFVERMEWMPTFNIQYAVGVDGISILLVLLTALLCPLCILCSWNSITTRVRAFMSLVLLVEGAMIVVFTALDLFLFFMLWEITMIPMYFMIILWGGPNRIAAGIKFVLYSLTGSFLLLIGILGLYLEGGHTYDLLVLSEQTYSSTTQFWLFLALFLAFAIKMPMVPFHTWLPDAHSEAPTAGSVILAGVLLKMGGYGFLRFCLPMFPEASAQFAPFILWLSVFAIIYGGYVALAQTDLKKLVAYSSVSHMGFVTLGIFAFNGEGIQGAILQMFNHGLTTSALFLTVGQLYDRTHSRAIGDYGGLHKSMPRFVALFFLFSVAAFGLPGTCNFIGEFLVLVGTSDTSFVMVLLAMGGIVLAAAYMLWMLQRVALGEPSTKAAALLPDLSYRELATVIPLAIMVLWIGLYPGPLMEMMDASVTHLVQQMVPVQPPLPPLASGR